ncbi:MAG TPA: GDSL-type esterase/lipase family protein [Polyangiaceae bacterium]
MTGRGAKLLFAGAVAFACQSRSAKDAGRAPVIAEPPVPSAGPDTPRAAPPVSAARRPAMGTPRPVPNPLISRGRPAFAQSFADGATARPVNDGIYGTWAGTFRGGTPKPGRPVWVAIDLGTGYRRVLLVWTEGGSDYTNVTYGSPADYRVEVSADSTNGADGAWRSVVEVEENRFHARGHSFDFAGQRFVRVVFLRAPAHSANGIAFAEIEVFDLSQGGTDTWFFMGDSITAAAYDRDSEERSPSFPELVHAHDPAYYPALINGGIGGENSDHALEHIDEWLAVNPDFKYWALGYGTNDAASNLDRADGFKANMQAVIERIRAAGRVPILARIPYATDGQHEHVPRFNAALEELSQTHRLYPGPNLYAWFRAHPERLADGLHPDDQGIVAMHRLWWEAVKPLYER